MRSGRKSASQTPAPLKDRIYGSKKNKEGSASSEKSAKSIILSAEVIIALKNKLKEFKQKHPNTDNITLNDLKAVYRRGLGAYSSTHRPTISGGRPNTRNAWAMARVNKFLLKAGGIKVKKAYVQDDDLIKYPEGGELKMYDAKPEHAKIYGLDAKKPLFIQKIVNVPKENDIKYILEYASKNGNDIIFGHIAPEKPDDIELIKSMLVKSGFNTIEGNNDYYKIMYAKGGLIAPNGKPSNLTPEQYKLVRTPEFKAWFGDWENDPENASKVVDENGEPLSLFRGNLLSQEELGYTFNLGKNFLKKESGNQFGFFFTNEIDTAKKYMLVDHFDEIWGGSVTAVFIQSNKILDLLDFNLKINQNNFVQGLIEKGVIFTDEFNYLEKKILDFNPNSYKYWGYNVFDYFDVFPELRNLFIKNGYNSVLFYEMSRRYSKYKVYVAFNSNQIKLADGTNTKFDMNNNDIRYNKGGVFEKEIMLPELNMSYDSLKRTLNNQGYNIEPQKDIVNNKNTNMFETLGKLFRPQNINYIAQEQNVPEEYARMQLAKGVEHEFEHTNDYETAKTIALHHLAENVDYYIMLEKAENQVKDKNYDDHFKQVYAQGGSTNFAFQTPTGKPTKLTYLQQVLVRTSSFKKWFGDWEKSAKEYILTDVFDKSFLGVSKCLDMETLEPRVVFHGTRTNEEFFVFNANMKGGRPYGYFAFNEQYSENFTANSQTGLGNNAYLYKVFLSVKNPFEAVGSDFDQKVKNAEYWKTIIAGQIQWQKNKTLEKDERLTKAVESQIGRFVDEVCSTGDVPFWMLMSRDRDSIFKRFLMSWGFDSVEFSENIRENFDVNNPSEFTYAFTIFDAPQVKLADGRNVEFDMGSDDMRYEEGGNLNTEDMNKYEHLKSVIGGEGYEAEPVYKSGGSVQSHGNNKKDDATKGGYFVGRPHSQGGIKAINISTNSPIEVEGGEVIITKPAVEDNKKRMFEGEMLTNREILSKINQSGGGVPIFEEGGMCGCSGKKYNFGGNVIEDFRGIYDYMVKPYIVEPISETMQYVDSLIIKRKK